MHCSWLVGSLIRQYGHSGLPCSSRMATSRTAPQREQGWARVLATQLRQSHCPPMDRCRWMTRRQPGQAGWLIACDPASQSWSISRSTAGMGASAPAPVSRSGRSCNTQANRWRCPTRGTAADTASAIWPAASVGSTPSTMSTIRSTGSRPSSGGHCAHRGRCSRSRQRTRRSLPHTAQGSRTGPQTPQYQCSPRRWKVRNCLPHSAQTGAEILIAPALRSAMSR